MNTNIYKIPGAVGYVKYLSRHSTLAEALQTAKAMSHKKHDATFGIIEDNRTRTFFVEQDFEAPNSNETLRGEYIQGEFIKPDD